MLSYGGRLSSSSGTPDSGGAFAPDSEAAPASFPVPERAALPKPERLNRNALTVVAVIMGVLVLAAVVFVQPTSATNPSQGVHSAPEAAQGTFLDQPSTGPVPGQANMGGATASSFDQRDGVAPASESGGPSYNAYNGGYNGASNSRAYANA